MLTAGAPKLHLLNEINDFTEPLKLGGTENESNVLQKMWQTGNEGRKILHIMRHTYGMML